MRVGTLEVKLSLPGVNSLKEKRHIVRSLKDRVRGKFNVAVAEVAFQDVWRTAGLGVVTVANDGRFVDSLLSKVAELIGSQRDLIVVDCHLEVF